jgi:hypothetical protein
LPEAPARGEGFLVDSTRGHPTPRSSRRLVARYPVWPEGRTMVHVHRPQPGVQEFAGMSISVPRAEPITPAESCDRDGAIPPLESGDRLTRDEFERRYQAMPHLTKAELIAGVVYVASPVRHRYHGKQHFQLLSWLAHSEAGTPGGGERCQQHRAAGPQRRATA